MSEYFPKPSNHKENIKVEIDLSNYATKADINNITHVDTSNFALKVTKVSNIDTSDFVLKTNYNTKITELENKIPDTSNLVKKTDYNTKITELKNKISDISNLATKTALTTVEIKFVALVN